MVVLQRRTLGCRFFSTVTVKLVRVGSKIDRVGYKLIFEENLFEVTKGSLSSSTCLNYTILFCKE